MKKILRLFRFRLFRIGFIVFLVIGGVLLYQLKQNSEKPVCKECNLILISVDTLRPDHMGVYGYDKTTTPNIDKWAKTATVFTNMRTVVPATYPSFSELMTGEGPFQTKIVSNSLTYSGISSGFIPINSSTQTLAQILKGQGFKTAAFINSPSLDASLTNINKGFDSYNNYPEWPPQKDAKGDAYKSLTNMQDGIKWLENNKNQKFFLWIHLMEPHAPYWPNNDFRCKFDDKFCKEIISRGLEDLEKERNELKECKDTNGLSEDKIKLFETLYDGAVASGDILTGEILKTIASLKLDKNTVVIFYGDHGEGFDHNYYFMHGDPLYDSQIKIPLIIKIPGTEGKKITTPFQNTQILATILDILKIPHKNYENTTNILSEKQPLEYTVSVNAGPGKYAIQNDRYKFIYSIKGKTCLNNNQSEELYDLQSDPAENTNLLLKKPDITSKLKSILLNFLKIQPATKDSNPKGKIQDSTQNNVIDRLKSLGY